MAADRELLRDWHRLFGLVLADFFTGTPFKVDIERDLSEQQQFLYVLIIRRSRASYPGRLPDGLAELAAHNLVTFKSHRESLDGWAVRDWHRRRAGSTSRSRRRHTIRQSCSGRSDSGRDCASSACRDRCHAGNR